ncbi:hypothetical protein [Cupriavidus metallidurans]|jgi:hypothetical protein|uniref:hypothetical protein n=2 Tax=Cupriavidus metallidurans TaxID=119219 RepID=UPI001BFCC60E|nr:hypothetical protein [Cupriavidus metallidurans]QWC90345.1 hypothetical protein KB891_10735 [Cupriavidus metallidurans]
MNTTIPTTTSLNVTASFANGNCTLSSVGIADRPGALAHEKAMKLHALLNQCYGEGFESFNNNSDSIKENLIWLAADLANEICALCELAEEVSRG